MTNSSRWGFVLRWQLAGMFVTLAAPAALIVADAVMEGLSLPSAVRVMPGQMVMLSVIVLIITPLSLLTLWGFAVRVVGGSSVMMRV